MFKRIDHVEILPYDVDRTMKFYTEILGFKLKNRIAINKPPLKEVIYLQLSDSVIELVCVENPQKREKLPQEVGFCALAMEVEDMQKALEYLQEKGVKIHLPAVDLGDSFRAEVLDPDSLVIELRQWK